MNANRSPAAEPSRPSASFAPLWSSDRRGGARERGSDIGHRAPVVEPADSAHVAGYLEAHERVADGNADSPDDAELWVPGDLDDDDRASWIEGFRSHFEP